MESKNRTIPIVGLILAESLSLLGNQIAAVAIPILVLQFTHSAVMTGIAGAGNALPVILAAIIGGRLIDKFGAWAMSIAADLLSFVSVLALPFAFIFFHEVSAYLIFLLVLLGALFDPTGISARQTLVPGLAKLSGKSLEAINSWRGGFENGADFLGPVIGVSLISTVGAINTFYINAITFVLCAVIFAISVPLKRQSSSTGEESAGLSAIIFIIRQSQLKALAIAGLIAGCIILPFLALLLPVLATQKFASTTLLGICLSVFGLSATIGAASFSWLSKRFSRSLIYYGGLLFTGSSILFCAFATSKYEVILCAALAGLLLGAGNPLQQTILHEETPEMIAGQIFATLSAIHFVGGPIGLLLLGVLTEYTNVETALISAGSLMIVMAFTGLFFLPLQKLNVYSDEQT